MPQRMNGILALTALLSLGVACSEPPTQDQAAGPGRASAAAVALQSPAIVEASGLAVSRRDPDTLWVINDGGAAPALHRIGTDGRALGVVRVEGAANRDWEDLASFRLDGEPWLLIADVGDNGGIRDRLTLYVVPEPADTGAVAPAWRIDFVYPDGPHDAESVAVDAEGERVLVLTKRTVPAELHALPLRPPADAGVLTTEKLMAVGSLPQKDGQATRGLLAAIPYHWQPTAMDIAADGRALVILTYADVYYYPRAPDEPWAAALARSPRPLGMPLTPVAEGVALDDAGELIFVTAEGRHAPLLRIRAP